MTIVRDPLDLRNVDDTFQERFWSKVAIGDPDECWPWLASTKGNGYGQFNIRKGVPVTAHRVSLALQGHVLTKNMFACHTCDNRPCVNPHHLFIGSGKDNIDDCVAKGRANRASRPGESNNAAKLTDGEVREIRKTHSTLTQGMLAERYGVSQSTISRILLDQSWSHLDEAAS